MGEAPNNCWDLERVFLQYFCNTFAIVSIQILYLERYIYQPMYCNPCASTLIAAEAEFKEELLMTLTMQLSDIHLTSISCAVHAMQNLLEIHCRCSSLVALWALSLLL